VSRRVAIATFALYLCADAVIVWVTPLGSADLTFASLFAIHILLGILPLILWALSDILPQGELSNRGTDEAYFVCALFFASALLGFVGVGLIAEALGITGEVGHTALLAILACALVPLIWPISRLSDRHA
jgi:Na+/melibiose symporter-like transporter